MKDVVLWRLLQEEHPPTEALTPLLRALAVLSYEERLPFFGLLQRVLNHADATVRAAAVAALGGAAGLNAMQGIVDRFDDAEPAVREAAVAALGASARNDPARWSHAYFHPDPVVRRAACVGKPPAGTERLRFALLVDPICTDLVRAYLLSRPLPVAVLPSLLVYHRQNLLTAAEARQLLLAMSWPGLYHILVQGPVRPAAEADLRQITLEPENAPPDIMDELFALFFEDPDPFFRTVCRNLLQATDAERGRVVASLLVTALRQHSWPDPIAETCAALVPEFLTWPTIPLDVRRRGALGLAPLGERCLRRPPEFVQPLVQGELCHPQPNRPDLRLVAAVLHLLPDHPYEQLLDWLPLPTLVAAVRDSITDALALLSVHDSSSEERSHLFQLLRQHLGVTETATLAVLVASETPEHIDLLGRLDADQVVAVFRALATSGRRLSENRLQRVAELLAPPVAGEVLPLVLDAWLALPDPETIPLGQRLLAVVARSVELEGLIAAARYLELPLLRRFLVAIAWCAGFPYEKEIGLAAALIGHEDKDVRDWAEVRLPRGVAVPRPVRTGKVPEALSEREQRKIATCRDHQLPEVVRRSMPEPRSGLCAALAQRPDPPTPKPVVCAALLASRDPLEEVARQMQRYAGEDEEFLQELEVAVVDTWRGVMALPLQGQAWLFRWDEHCFAMGAELAQRPDGLRVALGWLEELPGTLLRERLGDALVRLFLLWRYRDRPHLRIVFTPALGQVLVAMLARVQGERAAFLLLKMHESGVVADVLETLKPAVYDVLPRLPRRVRRVLEPWIDSRGLQGGITPVRAQPSEVPLDQVARATNLDDLERWAAGTNPGLARAAAERLVALGATGIQRLSQVLRRDPPAPQVAVLAETIAHWPDDLALQEMHTLVLAGTAPTEASFRIGVALVARGFELGGALLVAAQRDSPPGWFTAADWQYMLALIGDKDKVALALSVSPHPEAYLPAVEYLLAEGEAHPETVPALRAFLDTGTERLERLRLRVARWLHRAGCYDGLPLLLRQAVPLRDPELTELFLGVPLALVDRAAAALIAVGPEGEQALLALLLINGVDPAAREAGFLRLASEGLDDKLVQRVLEHLKRGAGRERKLQTLAETFFWGMQVGRELTGRLFHLSLIAGEGLGYTRLETQRIFINPLPLLRGEPHGREVVQGLILHELGHHVYHKGETAAEVWNQAGKEGLHRLLNLVSDEHLERNLRATEQEYGDKLKKLNAYAFQHGQREIDVNALLDGLQARAFAVLSAVRLGVARHKGRVAVQSGLVLQEMEQAGMSFARFMRALRMGLGNRQGDPLVAAGLELFKGSFRRSSMAELLERARKLRDLFGWETSLLDTLGQDALSTADDGEIVRIGEGITDAELQDAIQRILERHKGRQDGPPIRMINVRPEEDFALITTIVRVPFDREQHARLAALVARPARLMREWFQRLGIALEPQRFRSRGRRLDRTRLRDLVLRGDPRALIAREQRIRTDLFLGVVIDCSGSMQMDEHIARARLFGTLLAEAARGFPGIDVRLFGFTDQVIYDAGDAARCAVASLQAGGGNNDAAALWHAALQARASRRKARLLVMISDGLPTECSVAALRALVARLTSRWGICCAQVAVQHLEEICFPHYVVLDEADNDAVVRRFGQVVARLVRTALAHGP